MTREYDNQEYLRLLMLALSIFCSMLMILLRFTGVFLFTATFSLAMFPAIAMYITTRGIDLGEMLIFRTMGVLLTGTMLFVGTELFESLVNRLLALEPIWK